MVLPDPFREMGAWRNSTEIQQSSHALRYGPEIKNGRKKDHCTNISPPQRGGVVPPLLREVGRNGETSSPRGPTIWYHQSSGLKNVACCVALYLGWVLNINLIFKSWRYISSFLLHFHQYISIALHNSCIHWPKTNSLVCIKLKVDAGGDFQIIWTNPALQKSPGTENSPP